MPIEIQQSDADAASLRMKAKRKLAHDVGLTYVCAWLVGIGFGLVIRSTAQWRTGASWEHSTLQWFHAQQLPAWLDSALLWVPLTGTNLTVLPAMLGIGWWLWKRKQRPLLAVQLLVVSIGSLSLNPAMKYLMDRDRPDLFARRGMYNWASYPSGHAILTSALYFTLALLLHRERGWRWPYAAAAFVFLANSYSRLYLAVHWPTDLVGGLLIGLVWLAGTWNAFARYAESDAERHHRAPVTSVTFTGTS